MNETKNVAVLGLGYVGCVTAACLSDLGHRVIGVDRDESKLRHIIAGRAPFYEPGLERLIGINVSAGRLSVTGSTAEAILDADVALVCVGTRRNATGTLASISYSEWRRR
jgi:GDP-mannose 6-dehydrogenase